MGMRAVFLHIFIIAACFFGNMGSNSAFGDEPDHKYRKISWEDLIPNADYGGEGSSLSELNQMKDNDPESQEILERYIKQREKAPANPSINHQSVEIFGFVVPLEWDDEGLLSEFLLVPYFGACIHVPPPPQNQIIYVVLKNPSARIRSMDAISVQGKLSLEDMVSEYGEAAYRLDAEYIHVEESLGILRFLLSSLLTLICSLSISLGLWIGYLSERKSIRLFGSTIGFSAGIMFGLGASTLFARISWLLLSAFFSGVMVLIGIDVWLYNRIRKDNQKKKHSASLASFAIVLHNIPECFVIFNLALMNVGLGVLFGLAMMAHNIPLGISLSLSEKKGIFQGGWGYAFLSGIVPAFLGILIYLIAQTILNPNNLSFIFAFSGGVMVYISLRELIPTALRLSSKPLVLSGFLLGGLFMMSLVLVSPLRG